MSHSVRVRIACPSAATFAIQVELDHHYSDKIVATPVTTAAGDHHVIEFETSDPDAIYRIPLLVSTPGVTITSHDL